MPTLHSRTLSMTAEKPSEGREPLVAPTTKGAFWSRHATIINFWLDVLLLVLFMMQAWILTVLHGVFPRGAGPEWTIWGATRLDWSEALLVVFCLFATAVIVHVMLHWSWVCGVVSTRILGRKAKKDDGSQTLIGVGLFVLLIHLLAVGLLVARVGLTTSISIR